MKRSPEALAALDSLPNHPVFLCDLNAGVIAIALRFHARDSIDRYTSAESNKTYGFPCAQSSAAIRRTLEVAAEKLGALVDFSPILAILERPCAGHVGFDRGLHDGLEALADLALHPGHVVLDRHGWADDVPIEQLLGAIHLALFGSLPLIQHRRASGCPDCDKSLALGASRILAETLAGANISGSLRPGLRAPGLLVHAAAVLEGRESVFISPEKAALRLAVAAKRIVDTIDPAERAHLERFYPELVREAVALGVLPSTDSAQPKQTNADFWKRWCESCGCEFIGCSCGRADYFGDHPEADDDAHGPARAGETNMSIRRSKRIAVLVAVAALAGSTVILGIARALKTGV